MSQSASLRPPEEPERPAAGYATRDVAALLGLSAAQVRSYIRDGFLSPAQGPRGEYRFSFQDLILLRTAKGLSAANVPRRRIRLALQKLGEQLPDGRPLTGVRITAQGHQVVVRDGREAWNPESGQILLDFQVADLERQASSLARHGERAERTERSERRRRPSEPETAEEWYLCGGELELEDDADAAMAAYGRALALDPAHPDAHLNLGRLLHERGRIEEAEGHYRAALAARPDEPTAAYNLGTALQDHGRLEEAAAAYETALAADPRFADAHFNLAGVYERLGRRQAAFRHLRTYRTLTGG